MYLSHKSAQDTSQMNPREISQRKKNLGCCRVHWTSRNRSGVHRTRHIEKMFLDFGTLAHPIRLGVHQTSLETRHNKRMFYGLW
jgi:hypothetical protein